MDELDEMIDRKKVDEALRWALEQDDKEDKLLRGLEKDAREERQSLIKDPASKHPGGHPRWCTVATDFVCYMAVKTVMHNGHCSLTRACEALAKVIGRSAKGIARGCDRAYKREIFWYDLGHWLETREPGKFKDNELENWTSKWEGEWKSRKNRDNNSTP